MSNHEMRDLLIAEVITVVLLVIIVGGVFLVKGWLS